MLIEIGGVDVTDPERVEYGVRVSEEVGQVGQASIRMLYPPGEFFFIGSRLLVLPDDRSVTLPDDRALVLPSTADETPPFWSEITIDHPHLPYRAWVTRELAPWAYWRLDEGLTTQARDASGNGQHGTYGASGITQRSVEPPDTAVPYGAAPRLEDGAIESPDISTLSTFTVMMWLRISVNATGASTIFEPTGSGARLRLDRTRRTDGRHDVRVRIVSGTPSVTMAVDAGEWVHVVAQRTGNKVALAVNGVRQESTQNRGRVTAETDGRRLRFGAGSGQVLDADIDEVSIHNSVVSDVDIEEAYGRRRYWRAFGGHAYAPKDSTDGAGGRVVTVEANAYGWLLAHLHVEGVFASPTDSPAGTVLRQAFESAGWPYSTDGLDLDVPIERVLARVASLSEIAQDVGERASGLPWVDAWGDAHLDNAGAVRPLPVDLADALGSREATIEQGWSREHIAQRWRTKTIVIGAAADGGLVSEEFMADGATTDFDLLQQVSKAGALFVNGVDTPIGDDDADPWHIGSEDSVLIAASAPVSGTVLKFEYIAKAPLVAAAEDATAIAAYGVVERRHEYSNLDTIEAVQQRAQTLQAAHGRPGVEILCQTKPNEQPVFHAVGGAPRVMLGSTFDQRMLVEELVTEWLPGAREVYQSPRLRSDDFSSDLELWANERRPIVPPQVTQPIAPPITTLAVEGLALPVGLGGDYSATDASTTWVDIPGAVRVVLDGPVLGDVRIVMSLMARIFDWTAGREARVRLWDHTRSVRIGDEIPIPAAAALPYQQTGIVLPPLRIEVGAQMRMLTGGGEVGVWGVRLAAGISGQ